MFRRIVTVVGVVTMFSNQAVAHNVDYWSENFNKDKNCEDIQTLSTLGTAQCETVAITDGVERAFDKCIIHLEHILDKAVFKYNNSIEQVFEDPYYKEFVFRAPQSTLDLSSFSYGVGKPEKRLKVNFFHVWLLQTWKKL